MKDFLTKYHHEIIIAFYLPVAWITGRLFSAAPDFVWCQVYHTIGLHLQIIYLFCVAILVVPFERITIKILLIYLLAYQSIALIFYIHAQNPTINLVSAWGTDGFMNRFASYRDGGWSEWAVETIFIPGFVTSIYAYIWRLTRNCHLKSDPLNSENIFICLELPKTFKELFLGMFKPTTPYCSVVLYVDGIVYGFKKRDKKIHVFLLRDVSNRINIDTNVKISDRKKEIYNLEFTKCNIIFNSCFKVFKETIGFSILNRINNRV